MKAIIHLLTTNVLQRMILAQTVKKSLKFIKNNFFPIVICFFILYSLILIWKSSFVIEQIRYFVLFDDEMVSMRYAKNLSEGFGLVWNFQEPPVEGFSNLLWTLYMFFWHLSSIPLSKISLTIQLSGIVFSIGTLYLVKKLATYFYPTSKFVVFSSVLFTAFYFPLVNWNVVLGTEVSVLMFLVTLSTYLVVISIEKRSFSYLLWIILGSATLVRLDALIPTITIVVYLLVVLKKIRKRVIFVGIPIILAFIFLQETFRLWYFKEWLPNTYYLKMTGFPIFLRVTRGLYSALQFINPLIFIVTFALVLLKTNKALLLLSSVFLSQLAYSIYVGGDAWEFFGGSNRYISIVMPLFFVLLAVSLNRIKLMVKKSYTIQSKRLLNLLSISITFIILVLINATNDDAFLQWLLIKEPYTMGQNRYQVDIANTINNITTPDARIAITLAGVTPYFSDRFFVDLLGKNDKYIARMKVPESAIPNDKLKRFIIYYPGHMKSDLSYSLKTYKPDVIPHPITKKRNMQFPSYYEHISFHNQYDFYLLRNSEDIKWKVIEAERMRYTIK